MLFGWGKKKSVQVEHQQRNITLEDIPSILGKIKTAQEHTSLQQTNDSKMIIVDNLKMILDLGSSLEHTKFDEDDSDRRLRMLIMRGKKLVVDTIKKEASHTLPTLNTFDDILQLDDIVSKAIKHLGDVLGRQSKLIHIFAKKHADKLKTSISKINKCCDEVHLVINQQKNLINAIEQITEFLTTLNNLKQDIKSTSLKIEKTNLNIKQLDDEIILLKQKIDNIKSTSLYKNFLQIKKQLDEQNIFKSNLKNDIDTQFTKISRPLAKFTTESVFDSEQKIIYKKLVQDPIQVLTSENTNSIIIILQIVRKGVESGSVSVKNISKSLNQIDTTTEMLDSFSKKVSQINQKIKQINDLIEKNYPNDLDESTSLLKSLETDYVNTKNKFKTFSNEQKTLQNQHDKLLTNINDYLNKISSIKYIITRV